MASHVLAHFGRPDTRVTAAFVAEERNGGAKPLLLRLMPWLFGLAALVLLVAAVLVIRKVRPRRA